MGATKKQRESINRIMHYVASGLIPCNKNECSLIDNRHNYTNYLSDGDYGNSSNYFVNAGLNQTHHLNLE